MTVRLNSSCLAQSRRKIKKTGQNSQSLGSQSHLAITRSDAVLKVSHKRDLLLCTFLVAALLLWQGSGAKANNQGVEGNIESVVSDDNLPANLGTTISVNDASSCANSRVASRIQGIAVLPGVKFPCLCKLKGPVDGICVRPTFGSQLVRTDHAVNISLGSIIASVAAPSERLLIVTPKGSIMLGAGARVLVCVRDNLVDVINLPGSEAEVLIQLFSYPIIRDLVVGENASVPVVVALSTGYEFVASNHDLLLDDLQSAHGLTRDHIHFLDKKSAAICKVQSSLPSIQ